MTPDFARARHTLERLVAIPGISAKAFPPEEVRRSAEAVAETLLGYGLQDVRLLETAGHPAVFGELRVSGDAPAVLIYGHHDVQPPGRVERWTSPPFEAVVRDGRIYGRGTADDKGGFLAYLAAAAASTCNLKFLIEGEEEIGSPHLAALLDEHRALFASDFIVLCDTPNFDRGVPALTHRLRGNCIVDVEVRCLERPLHSGQGGGLVPDAIMVLCTLLARLDGKMWGGLQPAEAGGLKPAEAGGLKPAPHLPAPQLPFDAARVRRDFGLLDGVRLLADSWEPVWARPSLTITAIEAVPVAQAANQLADAARARLSLRTVRDMDTRSAGEQLVRALQTDVPHGAQVSATIAGGPSWWEADPRHPLFEAARRALSRGFGAEAVMIGSGGSIGFVKPFADLAGDVPPLLTGVQDPRSNAHSENESLDLGDWRKAMAGAACLFEELRDYRP